jgi:predicted unusual protein kinase regulating ubiquinone biosynthesis (AarF/ABC1/UbiB family)
VTDFPSSRFERSRIIAKTGLKVGTNYAQRYLKKKITGKEEDSGTFHQKNAEEVFKDFTKLRGTALKIAQGMSIDQGLLPEAFTEIMTQAQYQVPPINKALVRSIIKQELGGYPEQIFSSFSPDAIAAASIGQVHKAKLKDGRQAAVKIQYPNVRETINSDLSIAKVVAKQLVKKGSEIEPYFNEVKSTLLQETDYTHEGRQIQAFHDRFESDRFHIPDWIEDYSTERVLTMSYIEGRHLDKFLAENPTQDQRNHFGQLLWDFFHLQIEENDYVHADTHPGNFMFGYDGRLGIIDFGCVKKFPEEFFHDYLMLLPTHLSKDEEAIRDLYYRLDVLNPDSDNQKLEEEYFNFARNYGYTFAEPYEKDVFDFGNKDYEKTIRHFTQEAPLSNEPRGNKHFLYTTRVHVGLYSLLMKLGAQIDTKKSKETLSNLLDVSI